MIEPSKSTFAERIHAAEPRTKKMDNFEACIAHLRMPVPASQGDPHHQPA